MNYFCGRLDWEKSQKEKLNLGILTEEIYETISATKPGKSPGSDGLTNKFYKLYKEQLTPYMDQVMNDIMFRRSIPHSWNEAAITLIPKEGTDGMDVKNYRPILLLNLYYKIFAGVLAARLSSIWWTI